MLLTFVKSINRGANRLLALALLTMILWMLRILAIDIQLQTYLPGWDRMPMQFLLALGPLIYFYVLKITHPQYKFTLKDLLHFSPLLLEHGALALEISEGIRTGQTTYATLAFQVVNPALQLLIFISVISYLFFANKLIRNFYRRLQPVLMDRSLLEFRWLRRLLAATALLWVLWIGYAAVDYFSYHDQLGIHGYYPFYIFFAVIIIWTAMAALLRPQAGIMLQTAVLKPPPADELKRKGSWLKKTTEANRYYQDPELTVSSLAEKLGMYTRELSQVINIALKKNFNDFINEYRVRDAAGKMQDPAYDHITLLGIAYESGFNSKSTFNRIFKQMTGKSPVEYKQELKKEFPSRDLGRRLPFPPVVLNHDAPHKRSLANYVMIKTNFKLAFRNMFRNKLYTAINVTCLGVASAFCVLVYLYVKNEQSFDNFHRDGDRLYRVEETDVFAGLRKEKPSKSFFSFMMKDAEQKNMIQTPTAMGVDLKNEFPEIENAVRFEGMGEETIKAGNTSYKETDNMTFVDADFFKVFNYPLISGNSETVISELNHAAISEKLARKYFGNENPVGKTLTMPNEATQPPIIISGVFKDFPSNSSFQFDLVMSMESNADYKSNMARGVESFGTPLVIKLKNGTNPSAFKANLDAFAVNYFKPFYENEKKYDPKAKIVPFHFFLRPFSEAHYNQAWWYHYTDLKNIYQLVCLTVVIMLIACLNYILITLTNTFSRSQDVGIRKTIGARRIQVIVQYYTETQLIALISVAFGLLLGLAFLPVFGKLTNAPIDIANIPFAGIALFLVVLAILLGLIAGVYPALAMSGLKPLSIMKSFSAYKINPILSRLLIVVQFTVCVVLIISSLVINKQMHYINNADMGFDKDQVMIINSPYNWMDKEKITVLKQRMYNYGATEPGIKDVTTASGDFGGGNHNRYLINGQEIMLQELNVDFNFFSFMKVPIIKGRSFNRAIASDSINTVVTGTHKFNTARHNMVVNESLYNLLGKPEVGVYNDQMAGLIIGVCKDYHTEDLTKKIEPSYFVVNKQPTGRIWVRIAAGQNVPDEVSRVKAQWDKLTGNLPFVFSFMDQDVAKSYDEYMRWTNTINVACGVAILLACLGLFGLSGLTTINRTKEIGIRKVLGASVTNLFILVNKETLILAIVAFVIAAPIATYFTSHWLENFAYHVHTGWILFAVSGLIAVLTAVVAVSYHTIKAAMVSPVKSLRSE